MPTVYLTFDDGPRPGTADVISALESRQVPGTCFMVGAHVDGTWCKEQLARAQCSRYVEIGNHSMSHAKIGYTKFYSDPQGVLADFEQAKDVLHLSGPAIPARFPGRSTWRLPSFTAIDTDNGGDTRAPAEMLYGAGFHVFGWDVEWKRTDASVPRYSAKWAYREIELLTILQVTEAYQEIVLLTHDMMFGPKTGGRATLTELIDMLIDGGYKFDFISNYKGTRKQFWRFPPR
jgi:peptidoglycan/xylan/chitin deacetylase (PgdA/CDA1 family)